MTDQDGDDQHGDVAPSIWRQVVDAAGEDRMVTLLSQAFFTAAGAALDPQSKNVLQTLALATSAMLEPANWNEPFTPSATFSDGRRTALPSDLDDEQRALLRRIAAAMDDTDDPALCARVYDIC